MPAQVVQSDQATQPRDTTTGRFVRGEGDFQGPPKYANAPVTDRELGRDDETLYEGPSDRQLDPEEVEAARLAIQELPEGEVPSKHSRYYREVEAPQDVEPPLTPQAALPPPPIVDQNSQLLQYQLELMNRMLQLQEHQARPPAPPPAPRKSLAEQMKDDAFARQHIYDISAGRLNPEVPEHFALGYTAAVVTDRIAQLEEQFASKIAAVEQFQQHLQAAAQQQQYFGQAQQLMAGSLRDYAISDDAAAISQLAQQAVPYLQAGYDPQQVVQHLVGPMASYLARKTPGGTPRVAQPGQRPPAPGQQQGRLRQNTPAQQEALRAAGARTGQAVARDERPGKREKDWFKSVLAQAENHGTIFNDED